jgi:hypothetical protein
VAPDAVAAPVERGAEQVQRHQQAGDTAGAQQQSWARPKRVPATSGTLNISR